MSTPEVLYTKAFWLKTIALCFHVAAGAALGVLGSEGVNTLRSVPWEAVVSAGGFAALYALLASVAGNVANSDTVVKYREARKGKHAKPDGE